MTSGQGSVNIDFRIEIKSWQTERRRSGWEDSEKL